MSPPTATATSSSAAARRASAARRAAGRRRRRRLLLFGAAAAVIVAAVVAMPLFRMAVSEFGLPLQDQSAIREQAAKKHLDPALIAAVIDTETKFDPRTSSAGAVGLMQILPQTASFLAHRSGATTFSTADLGTPVVNIAYGSYYLRYLLDQYAGDTVLALAAYNGGQSNVTRWISEARADGHRFGLSDITFPETRAYVEKVLKARDDYRHRYASQLGIG
jgi:soluble lytic murein transglycosylase